MTSEASRLRQVWPHCTSCVVSGSKMSSMRSRISLMVNVSINSMTSSMCRAVSLASAEMYSSSISLQGV
jgi:hypothetical protein